MMNVNDKDSYNDRESDEDHDKKQILSYQRNDFRRRRNDIFNDEKKDSERHKDGGGEGKLFSFIRGEVEDQHGQKRQTKTWDYEKEWVKERKTFKYEWICEVRIGVNAVTPNASLASSVEYLPFAIVKEVFTVYVCVHQGQVHHSAIVCPRPKLHRAVLSVEGEKGDIHVTGGFIAGRRGPGDGTIKPYNGFGH